MAYPLQTGDEVAFKTQAATVRGTIISMAGSLTVENKEGRKTFSPNPYFRGAWHDDIGNPAVLMEHHKRWR